VLIESVFIYRPGGKSFRTASKALEGGSTFERKLDRAISVSTSSVNGWRETEQDAEKRYRCATCNQPWYIFIWTVLRN